MVARGTGNFCGRAPLRARSDVDSLRIARLRPYRRSIRDYIIRPYMSLPSRPTRSSRRICLICLDLGGVLIRVCRDWAEACRAVKLDFDVKLLSNPDLRRRLSDANHRHETGAIDAAAFDVEVAALAGIRPAEAG